MSPPPAVDDAGPSVTVTPDGPASNDAVKLLLKIAGTADDQLIAAAVAAVNTFVRRLPYSLTPPVPPSTDPTWAGDVTYGANLLAGRLYRRRNSPAGVESFSDLGGAVYVQRNDPDVAMMLGIGAYAKPIVR